MDNKRIAELAIATRTHLVEALRGLDEIIRLAEAAGRDDVTKAAKAAKTPVKEAAKAFNDKVDKAGGNATRIDPVELTEADKTAAKGKQTCEELLKELAKRVDGHDKAIASSKEEMAGVLALLGIHSPSGKPDFKTDGWAHSVNTGLTNHESRITALEESSAMPFPFNGLWGGLSGMLVLTLGMIFFLIINGATFGVALFWSTTSGLSIAVLVGFITAPRNKHNN